MPILTKQIYQMNKIREMDVPKEEKINLLRKIELDKSSRGCISCRGRIAAATKLLNQMIEAEIRDLNK